MKNMDLIAKQKSLAEEDEGLGSDFTLSEVLDLEEIYEVWCQNYEGCEVM